MSWRDSKSSYGWISILLHWLSGLAVIALWLTGDLVQGASYEESVRLRILHVSIALAVYPLIIIRIVWRLLKGHPRISGRSRFAHISAKIVHHLMFLALLVMVVSGPLVILGAGQAFYLFGVKFVLNPSESMQGLSVVARYIHGVFAYLLGGLLLVHVSAAFKHMMFDEDDAFIRILFPKKIKIR